MRRPLSVEEEEAVKWYFRAVELGHDGLSERDLDIVISIEKQYKDDAMLSELQIALLQKLYEKSA